VQGKRCADENAQPQDAGATHGLGLLVAAKETGTSALSASSTLNIARGFRFMNAATNVSGISWMRMLKVFTESL